MTEKEIIQKIEFFGDEYCREHLKNWDNEMLKTNWWEGLKFFFAHSFYRGRRDELSNEYRYFTIEILEQNFSIKGNNSLENSYEKLQELQQFYGKEWILKFKRAKRIGIGNSIKHQDFEREVTANNPIIKLLITPKIVTIKWRDNEYQKKMLLANDEDVMMVLDTLKFISANEKKNIYAYFINVIKNQSILKAYKELTKIRAVADKIASFTIRDIGLMNLGIIKEDYEMGFPVDTWVKKMSYRLGCHSDDSDEIKDFMLHKCKEYNLHPLKVAAGLWMWGFNRLDIEDEV